MVEEREQLLGEKERERKREWSIWSRETETKRKSRRGSRRPRDEDEEYKTREIRKRRTKKVCKANATKRDRETRLQSERVWETAPSTRMDARGKETQRLKNLDLYLDLSKERVVRHVRGRRQREGREIVRRARRDGERIRKEPGRYTNVNFTIKVAD